jgi:hypothetical protein
MTTDARPSGPLMTGVRELGGPQGSLELRHE